MWGPPLVALGDLSFFKGIKCLWGWADFFWGSQRGWNQFFSVGQRGGGTKFFLGCKRWGPKFFPNFFLPFRRISFLNMSFNLSLYRTSCLIQCSYIFIFFLNPGPCTHKTISGSGEGQHSVSLFDSGSVSAL